MQTRENMLDYVINLLEDAQDFSWASAKPSHALLLYRMEQGEVKKLELNGQNRQNPPGTCTATCHNFTRYLAESGESIQCQNHPFVYISIRVHAHRSNPMKPKGFSINMYVPVAG